MKIIIIILLDPADPEFNHDEFQLAAAGAPDPPAPAGPDDELAYMSKVNNEKKSVGGH